MKTWKKHVKPSVILCPEKEAEPCFILCILLYEGSYHVLPQPSSMIVIFHTHSYRMVIDDSYFGNDCIAFSIPFFLTLALTR